MTKLMSIDSSTSKTGWAVFVNGRYSTSGVIDESRSKEPADVRFVTISRTILRQITENQPDIIVIESVRVSRNMLAVRKLCELVGIVRGWAYINDKFIYEIAPSEWRSQLNMQKKGLKRDDYKLLSLEYVKDKYNKTNISDDESDAICIADAYCKMFS